MDKGAHFYKCDFQVHTPRDANWRGGDAITEAERKAYAEELILACRQKGLGAIAITDHHDFAFFGYVKKAAHEELDESGHPVPDEKKLVVFPGIEITLTAPSCQVLLILDAEFPENLLESVLTTLAISQAPSTDSKHATIHRIPQNVVNNLPDLYQKLNSHARFKGRFTVLPNVSDTGYGTMLRAGFGDFYKTMPCVGGYIDGPLSSLGAGALSIVNGGNRDYGFKSIGIFQTSDNRRRDHTDLGRHTTWVKWSEPTAEALRQACLAKESRLSQDEPELPSVWITSVSVSNSKFLGRVQLEFSQQYNTIIGGRGTGKSTILEYLRWGLCDQPVDSADWDDFVPVQAKRKKLIDDTLQKMNGEIIVTFLLNNVKHIIKRNSTTSEVSLKIGDSDFERTTEQDIRNLLPVQAYSQKQLSNVGVRIEELKRFVELPIKQSLDQIRSEIRDVQAKLSSAYGDLIRKREVEADIAKYKIEISSLTKQLATLRKSLRGLSESDQEIVKQKSLYDNEELIIESLKNQVDQNKLLVESFEQDFDSEIEDVDEELELQNVALIKSIREKYSKKLTEIEREIGKLSAFFDAAAFKEINDEVKKWDKLRAEFDKSYDSAKEKTKRNQQQLKQIGTVEKRINELNKAQMTNRNALSTLGDPEASYTALRTRWSDLHLQKIQTLGGQCQQFSSLSNGLIKADLDKSLDVESLKQAIKTAFAGLNIKDQKMDAICQYVLGAADTITTWNQVLAELQKLGFVVTTGTESLPTTTVLKKCGFIDTERNRLAAGLDSGRWLELSLSDLEFNPIFQYCTNKETNEYIDFADASAGQQATALLTVLLNQEGAPLIIDQPEDDVDSKMSPEIVQQIWKAKGHRQLIFASHNANFVVNGDAELVVCCDYVRAGDQTGGQIKATGAIDNGSIRDEITTVTEGGKEAFKLRKEKYGF